VIWRVVIQTKYFFAGSFDWVRCEPTGAAEGHDHHYGLSPT